MATPNPSHSSPSHSKELDTPQEEPETSSQQTPTHQSQTELTGINTLAQAGGPEYTVSENRDYVAESKSLPRGIKTPKCIHISGTMANIRPSAMKARAEEDPSEMIEARPIGQLERAFRGWFEKAPIKSPSQLRDDRRALLRKVAEETLNKMHGIVQGTSIHGTPHSLLVTGKLAPPLQRSKSYYPNFKKTEVKVVNSDTLDAALALHYAHDILESNDMQQILVLNFANAKRPGGGWRNGAMAQEEAICYRSTLAATLKKDFYPMADDACIYSPGVVIFRENFERGHSFMWTEKPELLPIVAAVSMAATEKSKVDKSAMPFRYKQDSERTLMEEKMRMVLRVAGDNYHRRLVLGAIGCGVFAHPVHEVANCWKRVLQENEFKGWFEMVLFAVLDSSDDLETFRVFKKTLHNLNL